MKTAFPRSRFLFLPVALFLAAALLPARAFPIELFPPPVLDQLNHCWMSDRFNRVEYEENAADLSHLLAAVAPQFAVRTCRDDYRKGRNEHYHLRIPEARSDGLCRLREQEVFRGDAGDVAEVASDSRPALRLRGWRAAPPLEWTAAGYRAKRQSLVLTADGDCPPPSDARYVRLTNAMDANVLNVLRFWKEATASSETFHRKLDHIYFNPGIYLRWQRTGSVKLLDELYQRVATGKAAPSALRCEAEACTLDIGIQGWFIEFRMTADGVIPYRHGGYLMA